MMHYGSGVHCYVLTTIYIHIMHKLELSLIVQSGIKTSMLN